MVQEKRFKVNMTKEALTNFMLTSYYSRFGGWFSILLGTGGIVMVVRELFFKEKLNVPSLVASAFIALLCLVVNPLMLCSQAKKAMKTNPVYQQELEYVLVPECLHVTMGDEHLDLAWDLVYKIKMTKTMAAIYTSKINAYVWPLSELGTDQQAIMSRVVQYTQPYNPILSKNLKKFRSRDMSE